MPASDLGRPPPSPVSRPRLGRNRSKSARSLASFASLSGSQVAGLQTACRGLHVQVTSDTLQAAGCRLQLAPPQGCWLGCFHCLLQALQAAEHICLIYG